MRERPSISEADREFLDGLLEQAIERLEQDKPLDLDAMLGARDHLRVLAEAVIRLAREVAVGPNSLLPRVRGYSILTEIGSGGMGTVYLARQERVAGRLVALKVLPASSALSPRARERFVREAEALARIHHSHVITIFDVVDSSGVLAYAMEYIDGQSFADWIDQRSGRRPRRPKNENDPENSKSADTDLPFICRIGISIARALHEVHTVGLLHRDVKPSNILIRRDGSAVLTDFGLAREADSTVTQPGHFVGTPAYSAPEQMRGDVEQIDARSDVYSLGATLYHALALRVPFEGDRPSKLLGSIEAGRASPLRRINSQLPRDLETIIAKSMDADPARRYQSADEFADDLERLLTLRPIKARRAGLATRTLKLARRNRRSLAAAIIGAILAMAITAAAVTYFVYFPRWAAAHVREARLALLDPGRANSIVSTLYWGPTAPTPVPAEVHKNSFQDVLTKYDRALSLTPSDEAIVWEKAVVEAARDGTKPVAGNLRSDGLYAFLSGDSEAAVAAWTKWEQSRDTLAESDSLVDAALGVLYLFDNQAPRAYPRLQKAVEAFPNVGFLLEYLADAAAKCGDTERARRWLEDSKRAPRRDTLGAALRIQAAILAAEGRTDDAIAAYGECRLYGPPQLELASLLTRETRFEEALIVYDKLNERFPLSTKFHQEFRACADRWWNALSPRERLHRIRAALDSSPANPESLVYLLRRYDRTEDSLNANGAPKSPCWHALAPAPELMLPGFEFLTLRLFDFSTALHALFFSPSLQSHSLSELAQQLEVHDMSFWSNVQTCNRRAKDVLFWSRRARCSWMTNLLQVFVKMRYAGFAITVAALPLTLTATSSAQIVPGFQVQTYATLPNPVGLTFDVNGLLYVGNNANIGRIYQVGLNGNVSNYGASDVDDPDAVAFDATGMISGVPGSVLIGGLLLTSNSAAIYAVRPNQTVQTLFGPTSSFENPQVMRIDATGRLIFTDGNREGLSTGGRLMIADGGAPTAVFSATPAMEGLAIAPDGSIFTLDGNGVIRKHAANGSVINPAFSIGAGAFGQLAQGPGVAPWGANLYALNPDTHELLRIDSAGGHTTIGSGFAFVAFDMLFGPDNSLYITASDQNRVVRISPLPCDVPEVSQHPQSANPVPGATVNFSLTATGTAPLSYQWRKGGVNLNNGASGCSSTISGATTATLTITNASTTDNAAYDCVVTNTCGSATSNPATLTVPAGPAPAGDMNNDGHVNAADIQGFVNTLLGT